MERIRVAVIGVGYLGTHHARILSELPGVDLTCVVDTDGLRAREIAEKYKTNAFENVDQVLDKIDAAVVAVPTVFHNMVSMKLIDAGKDILLEKPIAGSVAEADEILLAAKEKGIVLQVGHLERFNGAIVAMADYITTPLFIESHRLGPFAARGVDVDVALDLMIHDIDVILSIVKSRVKDVRAVGVPVLSDSVDIANARIEFESGCVANITASRVSVEKMRKLRIFQNDSYLSLDYQKQELKRYKKVSNISSESINLKDLQNISSSAIKIDEIQVVKEEPLRMELESFIACVKNRAEPIVSGMNGRDALEIAIKIKENAKENLSVMAVK